MVLFPEKSKMHKLSKRTPSRCSQQPLPPVNEWLAVTEMERTLTECRSCCSAIKMTLNFWGFFGTQTFWRIKQANGARLFFEQALIKKSARQKPIRIPRSVLWRAPTSLPSPPWKNSLPSPRFHPDSVSPGLCCSVSSSPFWAHHLAEFWIFSSS